MFDEATNRIFGGSGLQHVASTLTIWHQNAPRQGSYGKVLAIMANECAKVIAASTPPAPSTGTTES